MKGGELYMTEQVKNACTLCRRTEGRYCADDEKGLQRRYIHNIRGRNPKKSFPTKGRVETCGRFIDFMEEVEKKRGRQHFEVGVLGIA